MSWLNSPRDRVVMMQPEAGLEVNHAHAAKPPETPGWDQQNNVPYSAPATSARQQPKLTFGLGLGAFTLLISGVTAVIIGAALGGGLGAALASCRSSQRSVDPIALDGSRAQSCTPTQTGTSTGSTTSSNLDVPTPADFQVLPLDCPEEGQTTTYQENGYSIKWECGFDVGVGEESEEGPKIADIVGIIAYSMKDCMRACLISSTRSQIRTDSTCRSAIFNKEMAAAVDENQANCWLKNGTKKRGPRGRYLAYVGYGVIL